MQAARLRRLRENAKLRDWISETELSPKDIILPYFAVEGRNVKKEIKSMPGVHHFSIDNLLNDISEARGIKAILLFGVPKTKDEAGTEAYREDGVVQKAIKAIKREFSASPASGGQGGFASGEKELIVITDVCLCGYTTHGHCGIVKAKSEKRKALPPLAGSRRSSSGETSYGKSYIIDNDETIKILAKIALSHARAGADFVAPSAMMDGQVKAIREALDKNGFRDAGILAYSAKYASGFYGPFREALGSRPRFGDRKSYQMDYRNSDESLREIKEDLDEGADIVMIKPALAYLDVIYRAKQKFNAPIAAYNVSGEYSAIKKLAEGDKEREKELALEVLTSIKRAGADFIISYFGREVLRWLK